MSINLTPLVRPWFAHIGNAAVKASGSFRHSQLDVLRHNLRRASHTEFGKKHGFSAILESPDLYAAYSECVPFREYEDFRQEVMRMIRGEKDVLWPGICLDYAQSSGTSGGRSKYVPVTAESLRGNHYVGAAVAVAFYLNSVRDSKLFSGKGFILGGSFASQLHPEDPRVKVGDLSATLINKINPLANMFRVPDKKTALIPDWDKKLPALVKASENADITSISGVPSWFLTVIKSVLESKGADCVSDVWPNLEVFFHGGISFEPYREEYVRLCKGLKMHFVETYNASEGFFAVQDDPDNPSMLLLMDAGVFYEFIPLGSDVAVPSWEVECGKVYELVISSTNGMWRYRIGDTVVADSVNPLKIRIAGRTKCYINAFGEELMEDNAEKSIAQACRATNSTIRNYTVAPVFASDGRRGCHQWLVEWGVPPVSLEGFSQELDVALRNLNSDYDAKRAHSIFLDPPMVITAREGLFDEWLRRAGNHKLGGQRKVPRLSNNREIMEQLLALC